MQTDLSQIIVAKTCIIYFIDEAFMFFSDGNSRGPLVPTTRSVCRDKGILEGNSVERISESPPETPATVARMRRDPSAAQGPRAIPSPTRMLAKVQFFSEHGAGPVPAGLCCRKYLSRLI